MALVAKLQTVACTAARQGLYYRREQGSATARWLNATSLCLCLSLGTAGMQ